ncbi:hypothetical protein RISK_001487 [Rhodopirellula islandica]|uniref:Uncharacterized protein n=1 Tax=Rhodopirellula islandica TaxID=595434 RepID=A0A0J1BI87_RHOIS|nr:hypothetical protein [Rhodopirellula islandica]KLU06276.1 hypothetical protein RISK_001487 [Rhodopirellula islandica]
MKRSFGVGESGSVIRGCVSKKRAMHAIESLSPFEYLRTEATDVVSKSVAPF